MKKLLLLFFVSVIPVLVNAITNQKRKVLVPLVAPIEKAIDKHFQEYLTSSCRNAEKGVFMFKDCDEYLNFSTPAIARDIKQALEDIHQDVSQRGLSDDQCSKLNEELQEILLKKVLDTTEELHKAVRDDYFAATYMQDISSVALTISNGIKHPTFNREILKPYLQRQSERILSKKKKAV